MTALETLRQEMTHNHLYMTYERADELIDAAITEALTDPSRHQQVSEILRREVRMNPDWFREVLRREARIQGVPIHLLMGRP